MVRLESFLSRRVRAGPCFYHCVGRDRRVIAPRDLYLQPRLFSQLLRFGFCLSDYVRHARVATAKERVDRNRRAHKKCERKHYDHADPARNSPRNVSGFRATRALLGTHARKSSTGLWRLSTSARNQFTAETQRAQRLRREFYICLTSAPPLRPLRLCGEATFKSAELNI